MDKNKPIYNVSTMDDVVSSSVAGLRLYVSLATGFAVLALILASSGIYGMISYTTAGIRIANCDGCAETRSRILGIDTPDGQGSCWDRRRHLCIFLYL